MKKFIALFICLLLMLTSCKVRPADSSDEEILVPSTESKEYEISISVGEHTDGYKEGTYTVTGDDAKALDTLLKAKSYTGPNDLQAIGKIQLNTADSAYLLYISENKAYIENTVGGTEISLDDEIINIIEKYIKKSDIPEGTIIETVNSTYDYKDREYILQE